jgi:hypothetical protein
MPQDLWNEGIYGYAAPEQQGNTDPIADPDMWAGMDTPNDYRGGTLNVGSPGTNTRLLGSGATYQKPDEKATPTPTSGGGGFQYKPATGFDQSTTQTTTLPGQMPTFEAPTFTAPERSKTRVKALTQQIASPQARALRRSTRLALLRQHYDDPRGRENLRAILAGQGQGLSNIYGGATEKAAKIYEAEYATQFQAAGMNFHAQFSAGMANFKARIQDRLARATTTQTSKRRNRYDAGRLDDKKDIFGRSTSRRALYGHFPTAGKLF